jgi:uncharacterized membrane protein YraQ (UPF0718 family)
MTLVDAMAASARASAGFFWKAGWAFVMGYTISAMIQVFVPRRRLHRQLGRGGPWSVPLASLYGALSSSCSFAALAAARALVAKGASIVAGVAFMFASTNLVVELGVLILIFLGPAYLVAELAGGVLLIAISSALIGVTLSDRLADEMRARAEEDAPEEQDDFDWKRRLVTLDGWRRVGRRFGMEWGMVWEEIAIGFTVAGLMAALVPDAFWQTLFLADTEGLSGPVQALENALVGPLVAAATFIGSMGNIPLATVLAGSGVSFAGVMAFIYSDLMVPPLVRVNAKYYGWRGALYVAGVMYVSIVATALVASGVTALAGVEVTSVRTLAETSRFAIDYTFFLNVAFALVALGLVLLARSGDDGDAGDRSWIPGVERVVVLLCLAWVGIGLVASAFV